MKLIRFSKDDINLDIRFSIEENTIWMSQNDMSVLFKRTIPTILFHIKKNMDYINQNPSVVSKNETTARDGKSYKMSYYNLEIIEIIGNKIDPLFTKEFISWCKEQLEAENNQIMPIESNIIRFENDGVILDVHVIPREETVYLSQEKIASLFDTTVSNISMHIKNIYENGELEKKATLKDFLIVQIENGREVTRTIYEYNLDMILAIGYRVNSKKGIVFRKWATKVLRELLMKGYVINEERTLVTNDNYINLVHRVDSMDNRITKLEKEKNINLPKNVYLDGDNEYEAIDFLSKLIMSANEEIILEDAYSDHQTLMVLSHKKENVYVKLITSDKHKINKRLFEEYNENYKNLELFINNKFHDRFLIIDRTIYYDLGTSVNYAGRKISIIKKINDDDTKKFIDDKIYKTISSATNI